MKSKDHSRTEVPIRLHLEFDQLTVGELGRFLMVWQALIRAAWLESYEFNIGGTGPEARVVVETVSSGNSLDVVSEIAVNLSTFASSIRDMRVLAHACYRYIGAVWLARERRQPDLAASHVFVRGERGAEIIVPVDVLAGSETGGRIERMWSVANSGGITITVERVRSNGSG